MASAALLEQARNEDWTDEQVVTRVLAGETALYELLMRRHNQRLYRIARAILRDDAEAEDVMQDAYVRAYQHLASFEGRAEVCDLADSDRSPRGSGAIAQACPIPVDRHFRRIAWRHNEFRNIHQP